MSSTTLSPQPESTDVQDVDVASEATLRFMTFRLGDLSYGISIDYVIEIVGMQSITTIPKVPSYVKGVINLRGQVIPVIDMRLRFELEPMEYHNRTCIIVVSVEQAEVGLIVDSVEEVVTANEEAIEELPSIGDGQFSMYTEGILKIDGEIKMLLDAPRLLFSTLERPSVSQNPEQAA